MGQFDFPSAAALAQLKSEAELESPVDKAAARVAGIGAKFLEIVGLTGAGTAVDLILELKRLAANKDEANLVYFGEALVEDIRRLYQSHDEMRRQVEDQLKTKEFHQAVANATLHITRTNIEVRLKRVAILIANGIRFRDLETESLDDMMRAAVELKDDDIRVLEKLCHEQEEIMVKFGEKYGDLWPHEVSKNWQNHYFEHSIPGRSGQHYLDLKSCLSRLAAFGFIISVPEQKTINSPGHEPYGLLRQGFDFLQRIRTIPGQTQVQERDRRLTRDALHLPCDQELPSSGR